MRKFHGVLTLAEAAGLSSAELRAKRAEGWLPPIAGGALESNINALWVAKQTGRGAPATMTVGSKKMRWSGGDLQIARADGSEPFSDGTLFGDTVDFVNTLNGNGAPVLQGQSGIAAYLAWLACGQEVVTGGTNAVQTVSVSGVPTGGSFTLILNGFTSTPITFNSTSAAAQTALLAATNAAGQVLPAASITVGGGPLPATPLTVTFTGPLAAQPVPAMTFTNALTGGSTPTPAVVVTTPGVGYTHVATPNDAGGFWSSWVKSVGKSVNYLGQFNDARISALRYEGSSASKVVKVTPTLQIMDPGMTLSTPPTKTDDGTKPFIYTEAAGSFTIDNQVYHGHSAFAIEAQWALTEWYGEGVSPYDVINGRATVSLQGITIILDAQGLLRFNNQIFGVAAPAANARPISTTGLIGSYSCQFNRINPYTGGISESLNVSVPGVKWDPSLAIPANPAGGPVEFAMAGEMRKVAGQPPFTITTVSPNDPAYTA
jgi:hypothetical protein